MARQLSDLDRLLAARDKEPSPYKIEDSPLLNAFARSLSNVLDESSDRRVTGSRIRKSKNCKCHSMAKSGITLGIIPEFSAMSDSDSSLDDFIHQQMEIAQNTYNQYMDSDEICKADHHICETISWRQCTNNIGESDSVNESAYRSREPRRKRKFKRMAIDPPVESSPESSGPSFSKKNKHIRNLKLPRNPKMSVKCNDPIPQLNDTSENFPIGGKRKRCTDERSAECSGYDCKEFISDQHVLEGNYSFTKSCDRMDFGFAGKSDGSEMSSSESECELSTNDESREADDEQSDFFYEPGDSYDVLNSDEEDGTATYYALYERRFDVIPAFRNLTNKIQKMRRMAFIQAQKDKIGDGRPIRSAQRRFINAGAPFASIEDSFLPDNPLKDEYSNFALCADNSSTKMSPNEKKKKR